ncbi:MAG: OmpA family protein [Actinobacteria bacterium]|nr:OmpA family protein [Actinomycetota bacterium]
MNHEQQPMNRAERRRSKPRGRQAITGLAFLAAASVATAYGQLLRSPGAYAAAISCIVDNTGDGAGSAGAGNQTLRYCVTKVQANTGDGGTITFSGVSSITLTSLLPFITESTEINGGSGVTINGGNGFGFIDTDSAFFGKTLTLKNLTITGFGSSTGSADVIKDDEIGTLVIMNSTLSNNGNSGAGSGGNPVYAKGTLRVENSTFSNNFSSGAGGAVEHYSSRSLTISNSRFDHNGSNKKGGALYAISSQVTVTNSSFVSNTSGNSGGAIYADGTAGVTITNSYLGDNTAVIGSAIATKDDLTLNFTTLNGNTGVYGFGAVGLLVPGTTFTVNASVFDNDGTTQTACEEQFTSGTPTVVNDQYAVATTPYHASCRFDGTTSVENATTVQLDLADPSTQDVSGVTQTFRMPSSSSILVTGAPSGALSTGITTDQVGTTRSGTFTIGSVQVSGSTPPAPPAPPGPAPAPEASATPTPTPRPSASISAAAQVSLDPVTGTQNPNVPAAGLPAGGSVLLVDGQPVPVKVRPDAPRNPSGLDVEGNGWNMQLVGRGGEGDPLGLSDSQALILQSQQAPRNRSLNFARKTVQPVAQASGKGFKPLSPVKFYLLPGTSLGELTTDASGAFAGAIPMPAGIAPGTYTLQSNAFAPDGSVRSLSLGVIVKPALVASVQQARAKVLFAALSSQLDASAQARLRLLAAKVKRGAVKSVVVGYVQPTASATNDLILSTARARAVAAYLKSQGVAGVFVVSGAGQAKEAGAAGRRVEVVVTYR